MIGLIFGFGSEIVEIRIENTNVLFRNQKSLGFTTIDGLKLDYKGVCREFPDLELRTDWREEAINRFKEKIKSLKTESERADYIIEDLKKYGYVPMYMQKKGFRTKKIT